MATKRKSYTEFTGDTEDVTEKNPEKKIEINTTELKKDKIFWQKTIWYWICWTMLLCIIAIILAIISSSMLNNLSIFRYLISEPYELELGYGELDSLGNPINFIERCVNDTPLNIPIIINNHEKFSIGHKCRQNKNKCEFNVCNINGKCENTVQMGECFEDTQCYDSYGQDYKCNTTTCNCVFQPQCSTDSQCPDLKKPCSSMVCNSTGFCVEILNDGATCSSSDQCFTLTNSANYICNQTTCGCQMFSLFGLNYADQKATIMGFKAKS